MTEIDFTGRVAIVTGAGNGLGRSHALMLAERGASVIVNDLGGAVDGSGSSTTAADETVDLIRSMGGKAIANYDSVTDPQGAMRIVETAMNAYGRIDVLINNAGVLRDRTLAKMDMEAFRFVVDVHLIGSANCSRAVWGVMKDQGYGRIVMTTSGAGLYGNFGQSNYGAAKLGVVGLMNVLKLEGARGGITVNTVAPVAATRMTEAMMPTEALPHLRSDYISAAAAYLASDVCKDTGVILSAGAGYFACARFEECEGVFFDTDKPATPEMILDKFSEISDFSTARPFASATDYMNKVLARFSASLS